MITPHSERAEHLRQFVSSTLFQSFSMTDLDSVYDEMQVRQRSVRRGEVLYGIGDEVERVALVLDGCVLGYSGEGEDRNVIVMRSPGHFLGLAPFLSGYGNGHVVMEAVKATNLLEFDLRPLLDHPQFGIRIRDAAMLILTRSSSNDLLRMSLLLRPSIRERVMAYFDIIRRQEHTNIIQLSFNQSGFADYLGINRSALNRELNKMQKEGLLEMLPKQQYRLPE